MNGVGSSVTTQHPSIPLLEEREATPVSHCKATLSNGETEYALAFNLLRDNNDTTISDSEDEVPAWVRCAPDDLYYVRQAG